LIITGFPNQSKQKKRRANFKERPAKRKYQPPPEESDEEIDFDINCANPFGASSKVRNSPMVTKTEQDEKKKENEKTETTELIVRKPRYKRLVDRPVIISPRSNKAVKVSTNFPRSLDLIVSQDATPSRKLTPSPPPRKRRKIYKGDPPKEIESMGKQEQEAIPNFLPKKSSPSPQREEYTPKIAKMAEFQPIKTKRSELVSKINAQMLDLEISVEERTKNREIWEKEFKRFKEKCKQEFEAKRSGLVNSYLISWNDESEPEYELQRIEMLKPVMEFTIKTPEPDHSEINKWLQMIEERGY